MPSADGCSKGDMNLACHLPKTKRGDGNLLSLVRKPTKPKPSNRKLRKAVQSSQEPDPNMLERPLAESGLLDAFCWNSTWRQRLEHLPTHGLDLEPSFQGHFEFAGGGGAEMAARGLAAVGCPISIVSQSDWDRGKKRALELNDPEHEVCKFSDIMNCVDPVCRPLLHSLVDQKVVISQYELHGVLNIRRCFVPDGSDSDAQSSTSDSDSSDSSQSSVSASPTKMDISGSRCATPTSDETSIYETNNESFVDVEWVRTKLLSLFQKEHLKTTIGSAERGWKLERADCISCGTCMSQEISERSEDLFQDAVEKLVEIVCADHNCSMKFVFKRRLDGPKL